MRPSSQPAPIGDIIEEMVDEGFFGEWGRRLLPLRPDAKLRPPVPALDEPRTLIPV
jgi:hypothetical protein